MKKSTFFGLTQGFMWGTLTISLGFKIDDWQFWVIILGGSVIFAIIYNVCKED